MNPQLSSLRIPRLVLSLSLILWVGGAGCLIGCESMAMAASGEGGAMPRDQAMVVAGESCAQAAHSCCAKHHRSKIQRPEGQASAAINALPAQLTTQAGLTFLLPTFNGPVHICPLAMNSGVIVAKARPDESTATRTLAPAASPFSNSNLSGARSPRPAWFSNRGHTYLYCCVFLI